MRERLARCAVALAVWSAACAPTIVDEAGAGQGGAGTTGAVLVGSASGPFSTSSAGEGAAGNDVGGLGAGGVGGATSSSSTASSSTGGGPGGGGASASSSASVGSGGAGGGLLGNSLITSGYVGQTCLVTPAGGAMCWGDDFYGEIGDGHTHDTCMGVDCALSPVDVSGLGSGVVAITAGDAHVCALLANRRAACWGWGDSGQLGIGSTGLVCANGYHCLPTPVLVPSLVEVIQVSAGGDNTCAVAAESNVFCWGDNSYGQLGDNVPTHGATCFGSDCSYDAVEITSITEPVQSVAVGYYHTCALTRAGAVRCWGRNEFGELGDGTTTNRSTPVTPVGLDSGVAAITAGGAHSCALMTSGAVKCWGIDRVGELGLGSDTGHDTSEFFDCSFVPRDVPGLSAVAIFANVVNTCAITTSGGAVCWGWGGYGMLGDGMQLHENCVYGDCSPVPVDVVGLSSGVTSIGVGQDAICATTVDGRALCWGGPNTYGSLGGGSTMYSLMPVEVVGF